MILNRDLIAKIADNNRTNISLLEWADDSKVNAIVERLCTNIFHAALQDKTNLEMMCYINDITDDQADKILRFMKDILGYTISIRNDFGYYSFNVDFRRRF